MLRRRMGDERFFSLLAGISKRYDHQKISTDEFRMRAAELLPPKSEDPKLEGFFEQWVYGTGIPSLKMTYTVKGKAPALRVVGTIEQADVDEDFSMVVPVEIQLARGKTITQWVRTGSSPVTFTCRFANADKGDARSASVGAAAIALDAAATASRMNVTIASSEAPG